MKNFSVPSFEQQTLNQETPPTVPEIGFYQRKIPNVHADIPNRAHVAGLLDPKIFHYFFRQVMPGERGPRNALISYFFQQFYQACLAAGIEPVWDEDNEAKVWEVLQRMNFNPPPAAALPAVETKKRRIKKGPENV